MCGIAGIVNVNPSSITFGVLKSMTDSIAHRGPDGEGHWIGNDGNCGLGHRRLSIIDLSAAGSQPMHYRQRYAIVFNGEIYNYLELKRDLKTKGYAFQSQSDTEVLLALYDLKKQACLDDIDGMFAFAIFDRQEKKLFCARDRFGEKPFFYSYKKGSHFIFASEMKALWAAGVSRDVNNRMMYNYLAHDLVENPEDLSETFFVNCNRLPPGHYTEIYVDTLVMSLPVRYWEIDYTFQKQSITAVEARVQFRALFSTSVDRRLRSDVPVGSSLSGGLDSSLVVCQIDQILKSKQRKFQKTFSARFPGSAKDEGEYMQAIIDQTSAEPHYVYPSDKDFSDELEKIIYHQEEPFHSSSIYAQFCVMRLAKENGVTVLLDGQGADEILAGYHKYYLPFFDELKHKNPKDYEKEFFAYQSLHRDNNINGVMKKDLKYFLKTHVPGLVGPVKRLQQNYQQKKAPFFSSDFYLEFKNQSFSVPAKYNGLNHALEYSTSHKGLHTLLRYADRNSMAHSREVRLPFLYHDFVNFVFSLPSAFKVHDGWTKWIMREAYKDLLPATICWRKEKIGYETPEASWLKSSAVKEAIFEKTKRLVENGIVSKVVLEQQASSAKYHDYTWKSLMAGSIF